MNLLLVSIIEAIYIVYMLNFFKTKYSLAHPFTYFSGEYIKHPIGIGDKPRSNICRFGHDVSWILACYVIIRGYLLQYKVVKRKILVNLNKLALVTVFCFSLMNFNAIVYLIPFFITEICLFIK